MYSLSFSDGVLTSITNKESKVTVPFAIDWGWYNSSVRATMQRMEH